MLLEERSRSAEIMYSPIIYERCPSTTLHTPAKLADSLRSGRI
jgi:hypothetical protein